MSFYKIIMLTASATLATSLISGCGGSESPYTPDPGSGTKRAQVLYALVGMPMDYDPNWECEATVSVLGEGTKTLNSSSLTVASFSLPDGQYEAEIDVECGCGLLICGISTFTPYWVPSIERSGAIGSPKHRIPGQAVNGFTARDTFTIRDKTLVASSKSTTTNPPNSQRSTKTPAAGALNNFGTAAIEFTLVDYSPKDQVVTCDLDHRNAYYGGYGFHNVQVTNEGGNTISGWNAYIDFGDASPTSVQWTVNADATVGDTGIVVSGDDVLAPGQSATFSIGGQYTGQNIIDTICY